MTHSGMLTGMLTSIQARCLGALWMFAISFASGCGGSSSSDIVVGDGGPDSGDANSFSDDGSSDAGSTSDTGTSDAGTTDGSIVADGGVGADGGPGGDMTRLACGGASCAIPGVSCCIYQLNNGPPDFAYACVTGTTCPARGGAGDSTLLQCAGAANCAAGKVCCVKDRAGVVSSSCETTCVAAAGAKTAQLCDPAAATTGCTATAPCSHDNIGDWGLPNTFATCGGVGN